MIASIHVPDLPALALQMALGTRKQLLVFSAGRIVAPYELAGMTVERAKTLRPYACPLTRQPSLEKTAWDHIVESVFDFTPYLSEVCLGRLFCEADNMTALRTLIGATHARVGLAHTRTMALLASLAAKPGGIVTVDNDDIPLFLDELPVSALTELTELELDSSFVQRLNLFGLGTVGRIRRLTRTQLHAQFGEQGVKVHQLLHSLTDRTPLPLYVPAPDVKITVQSYEPSREPGTLEAMLQEALAQAMVQLGNQRCGRVEIALLDSADNTTGCISRVLRAATTDPRHLLAQTTIMLHTLLPNVADVSALQLRLLSLSLTPPTQTLLFKQRPSSSDVNASVARRFPQAVKRVTVIDSRAYLPDRFATIDVWKPTAI